MNDHEAFEHFVSEYAKSRGWPVDDDLKDALRDSWWAARTYYQEFFN